MKILIEMVYVSLILLALICLIIPYAIGLSVVVPEILHSAGRAIGCLP